MNTLLKFGCAAVLMATPSLAHAKPSKPFTTSEALPACAFAGIGTFDWGVGITYIDCLGAFSGNTTGAFAPGVLTLLSTSWAGPWEALAAPAANTTTGVLTFSEIIGGRFALGLKQGDAYSLYLFSADAPVTSMRYTTAGVQAGATTEFDLSHPTLYGTHGGISITCFGEECTPTQVPEPTSYALMAAGLLGLFGAARRSRRPAARSE